MKFSSEKKVRALWGLRAFVFVRFLFELLPPYIWCLAALITTRGSNQYKVELTKPLIYIYIYSIMV